MNEGFFSFMRWVIYQPYQLCILLLTYSGRRSVRVYSYLIYCTIVLFNSCGWNRQTRPGVCIANICMAITGKSGYFTLISCNTRMYSDVKATFRGSITEYIRHMAVCFLYDNSFQIFDFELKSKKGKKRAKPVAVFGVRSNIT